MHNFTYHVRIKPFVHGRLHARVHKPTSHMGRGPTSGPRLDPAPDVRGRVGPCTRACKHPCTRSIVHHVIDLQDVKKGKFLQFHNDSIKQFTNLYFSIKLFTNFQLRFQKKKNLQFVNLHK